MPVITRSQTKKLSTIPKEIVVKPVSIEVEDDEEEIIKPISTKSKVVEIEDDEEEEEIIKPISTKSKVVEIEDDEEEEIVAKPVSTKSKKSKVEDDIEVYKCFKVKTEEAKKKVDEFWNKVNNRDKDIELTPIGAYFEKKLKGQKKLENLSIKSIKVLLDHYYFNTDIMSGFQKNLRKANKAIQKGKKFKKYLKKYVFLISIFKTCAIKIISHYLDRAKNTEPAIERAKVVVKLFKQLIKYYNLTSNVDYGFANEKYINTTIHKMWEMLYSEGLEFGLYTFAKFQPHLVTDDCYPNISKSCKYYKTPEINLTNKKIWKELMEKYSKYY